MPIITAPRQGGAPGSVPISAATAALAASAAVWAAAIAIAMPLGAARAFSAPTAAANPVPIALNSPGSAAPQCLVMSPIRAARDPPMKTLLEPVAISNGGASVPQVTARPRSPARAAGTPPINTERQPPTATVPMLGRGIGGAGGTRLGGCRCVCGVPMCGIPSVAAGSEGHGISDDSAPTPMLKASTAMSMFRTPSTPLTTVATFSIAVSFGRFCHGDAALFTRPASASTATFPVGLISGGTGGGTIVAGNTADRSRGANPFG